MEKHIRLEESKGYSSEDTFVPKSTLLLGLSKDYAFMDNPGVLNQTTSSLHSAIDK